MAIGDLHAPFQHPRVLQFLKKQIDVFKPDKIVLMGDEVDFHALSRFTKEMDAYSVNTEFELACKFMKDLFKLIPQASVCTSNHTERYIKRAKESGLPPQVLRNYHEIFDAPMGWQWCDEIKIDGVNYIHGEQFTGRDAHFKAAHQLGRSVVIGHIHAHAGLQWLNNGEKNYFGFNVGCLIDEKAYAFRYSKQSAFRPTLGVGVVVDGSYPTFIPMR